MIRALLKNSGTEVDGSEKIIVFRISYFEKFVEVLKETSDRTIGKFLLFIPIIQFICFYLYFLFLYCE